MLASVVLASNLILALTEGVAISTPYETDDYSKVGTQSSIFQFLDGSAPYFTFPQNYSIPKEIPEGCKIKQVQVFARHGERFPTKHAGKTLLKLWSKLSNYSAQFNGSLEFLNNNYKFFFTADEEELLVDESRSSNLWNPYMGTADARKHAGEFLEQYSELLEKDANITAFCTNSNRVHETAENFIEALGDNYNFNLEIISEDGSQGANSLTPAYACAAWNESEGIDTIDKFDTTYLSEIAERVTSVNKGLNFTKDDAFTMFNWCAFELNVKGYSDACNMFTEEELIKYSYYSDLEYYYSDFVGCSVCKAIGSVPFNASLKLLTADESTLDQKVWISFTHDTDIVNYLSAVGLFDNGIPLTGEHMPFMNHAFHKSWIAPCGARLYTQKFECPTELSNGTYTNTTEDYVRYVLNDVVIPIENCSTGPGFSCELQDFVQYAEGRMQGINFAEQCDISQYSNITDLTFYWDYKTKNYTSPLILQ